MSHSSLVSKSPLALLALGGLLLSVPAAQAQTNIISFSFSGNPNTPQNVQPDLYAGVVPAMNFNTDDGGNSGGGYTDLAYSDGTDSFASVSSYNSYDAQNGKLAANSDYQTNGNEQLLNGFIESGPPAAAQANATVTVDAVPFTTYDLYVYGYNGSLSNATTMGTYTVTPSSSLVGTSQTVALQDTFNPSTPFTLATATTPGDYLVFTGLTGSSFTLTADRVAGTTDSTTFIPIDGFQIVSDTPAAVPEASTTISFGLLLALGLGAAVVRRKKAAAAV